MRWELTTLEAMLEGSVRGALALLLDATPLDADGVVTRVWLATKARRDGVASATEIHEWSRWPGDVATLIDAMAEAGLLIPTGDLDTWRVRWFDDATQRRARARERQQRRRHRQRVATTATVAAAETLSHVVTQTEGRLSQVVTQIEASVSQLVTQEGGVTACDVTAGHKRESVTACDVTAGHTSGGVTGCDKGGFEENQGVTGPVLSPIPPVDSGETDHDLIKSKSKPLSVSAPPPVRSVSDPESTGPEGGLAELIQAGEGAGWKPLGTHHRMAISKLLADGHMFALREGVKTSLARKAEHGWAYAIATAASNVEKAKACLSVDSVVAPKTPQAKAGEMQMSKEYMDADRKVKENEVARKKWNKERYGN